MPSKAYVKNGDMSFVTRLVTDRVNNTDTYTVASLPNKEEVRIPSSLDDNGVKANIKLSEGLVPGENIGTVLVPKGSDYSSVFGESGIEVVEYEDAYTPTPDELAQDGFILKSNNIF